MALTAGELPSAELLASALGVDGDTREKRIISRQLATFRPCAGCVDPRWCAGFRPVVGGPAVSPDCAWREQLTSRLDTSCRESPLDAIAVVPIHRV